MPKQFLPGPLRLQLRLSRPAVIGSSAGRKGRISHVYFRRMYVLSRFVEMWNNKWWHRKMNVWEGELTVAEDDVIAPQGEHEELRNHGWCLCSPIGLWLRITYIQHLLSLSDFSLANGNTSFETEWNPRERKGERWKPKWRARRCILSHYLDLLKVFWTNNVTNYYYKLHSHLAYEVAF